MAFNKKLWFVFSYLFIFSFSPLFAEMAINSWSTAHGYKIYQILDGKSNSFLVEHKSLLIMVDTGRKSKWKELQNTLNKIGADKDNLKALIITHAHYDHVENAYKIKKKYGTKVVINELESKYLNKGTNSRIGLTSLKNSKFKGMIEAFIAGFLRYKRTQSDIITGDTYDLQELGFSNCCIIKTAGHTYGSVCIVIDGEIVITGDTIVNMSGNTLPWYFVSKEDLLKSWKLILNTGSRLYLPAHGPAVTRDVLTENYTKQISDLKGK